LLQKFESGGYSKLIRKLFEGTEAADITEAGIFDRKNLDLPYSTDGKLVAILGDAAHPQSPFAGQGVNMAIADAYVLSTRIAMTVKAGDNQAIAIPKSISAYDTSQRCESVKAVVKAARDLTNMSISSNPFICWMMRVTFGTLPLSWILDATKYDKSNDQLVKKLQEDYPELQMGPSE